MPQKRYYDFLADDDTASLNRWRTGLFMPGMYFGYDFVPSANMQLGLNHATSGFNDVDSAGAIISNQSLVVTRLGFIIKENAALNIGPVAVGDVTNPRIDVVVLTHSYIATDGGQQALYSIIQGTPGSSPSAPALTTPATQIKIGQLFIPAGTTALNGVGVTWTREKAPVFSSWTTMEFLRNVTSDIQSQLNAKQATIDSSNRLNANLVGTGSVDNTEYGYLDGVSSSIQTQFSGKQATITGAASTITSSNLTANRAVASDGSGKIINSAVLDTELNALIGIAGNIQTGKQDTITGAATTITSSNLTANRLLIANGSGKVAVSTASDTEATYLVGVTSSIQTQFSGKQATITGAASTITSSNLTASRALISDGSGKVAVSAVSQTSLEILTGVNSGRAVSSVESASLSGYKTRIYHLEITNWNMQTGPTKIVPHGKGVDFIKIRSRHITIINDGATGSYSASKVDPTANQFQAVWEVSLDVTNFTLQRGGGTFFDDTPFSGTGLRGWITYSMEEVN